MNLVPVSAIAHHLGLLEDPTTRHNVALVGGGGKTTLMHAIGMALPAPTVLTCTTKMGADQHRSQMMLVRPSDEELERALAQMGHVLVVDETIGPKAIGVSPARAGEFFAMGTNVVAEADGSRRRPAKAPAWYEPVLPIDVTLVVCVIGADALDRTIEDQCHRPMRVGAVLDCSNYDRLTPERAAELVTSHRGGRKDVPTAARFAICVTKVNDAVMPLVSRFVEAVSARDVEVHAIAHFDLALAR